MTESSRNLRKIVLEMAYNGRDANLQSIFSSMDIIDVLYNSILSLTPININDPNRDYFILSKGQSTMGLLAALAEKGILPIDELKTACSYESRISMQADRTKIPGIEVSAGSLGHGFPISVGIAWGNKLQNRTNQVYTLVGDGEMNEGTMWEAALFAGSEKLNNLTLIIDDNSSLEEMINIGNIGDKLSAFGFEVFYVNGHSKDELLNALSNISLNKPRAVIAKTIRGYGSKTLMLDNTWFHRAPNLEELKLLMEEVEYFD